MKASMKRLAPQFSTNRMLWEYGEGYYLPAARYHAELLADGGARALRLAEWKTKVFRQWSRVRVESVEAQRPGTHRVGDEFPLVAIVNLGSLAPGDVSVEAYFGRLDDKRQIAAGSSAQLSLKASLDGGRHRFAGVMPCDRSGMQGYTVRVRPAHPDANGVLATGLMTWW
jgi:starch phosphorylase